MENFLDEFIYCSLLMGLGIGIDAAIATSLRASHMQSKRIALRWIIGVSLTHTLFPLIGYFSSYLSLKAMPFLTPLIGLIAFLLIAHFLYYELKDQFFDVNNDKLEHNNVLISIGLILAVSWDALWSGPAKSAQVVGWPEFAVWGSFILVGFTVAFITALSLILSLALKQMDKQIVPSNFRYFAQSLQYSVIAYFGWLALSRYTFDILIPWQIILLGSFLFISLLMLGIHRLANKALAYST